MTAVVDATAVDVEGGGGEELPPFISPTEGAAVYEMLTDEECYLVAILTDPSGLDIAEFLWVDEEKEDGCWRAWEFQWAWWRCQDQKQIDQSGRSIGKSESIMARACSFIFRFAGQEMVITAPQSMHTDAITNRLEGKLKSTRLLLAMIRGGLNGFKHKPFHVTFLNNAQIMSRIPQLTGLGIKGCVAAGTLILAQRGLIPVEDLTVDDEVYTHMNRWRKVLALETYEEPDAYTVKGVGAFPFIVSAKHRFLTRLDVARSPGKQKRELGESVWCAATRLRPKNAYWASPATFRDVGSPPELVVEKSAKIGLDKGRSVEMTSDFWWLVGRYLADGFLTSEVRTRTRAFEKNLKGESYRSSYRVHICVVPSTDQSDIINRFANLGLRASVKKRDHSSADVVEVSNSAWGRWLEDNVGKNCHLKILPTFVLGIEKELREAVLAGYLAGDGTFVPHRDRHAAGSASKRLIVGMKLLAQSLGMPATVTRMQPTTTEIMGVALKSVPRPSWRVSITPASRSRLIHEDGFFWGKVNSSTRAGTTTLFNPVVDEDHSYIADGIVSHNTHPVILELDEAQDYPENGWSEIRTTLKRASEGAQWRVHGVTKGLPDDYYDATQEGSGFTVHHYTGMHRPTWTDEEREEMIREFKSKNDPNYRRNILGIHGDATNAIFDLRRLMRCVDQEQESTYNAEDYWFQEIRAEQVEDRARRQNLSPESHGQILADLLDFPESHKQYKTFWAGMDVGITRDPSAIVVFAEYLPNAAEKRRDEAQGLGTPLEGASRLKLLMRLELLRISTTVQVEAILKVIDFYRPRAFAMDATGNGLGMLQQLQQLAMRSRLMRVEMVDAEAGIAIDEGSVERANDALTTIKGYNFGGKVVVEINEDEAAKLPAGVTRQEVAEKAGVKRLVKEYATDQVREMVDRQRLLIPWDRTLLKQMNGQTFVFSPSPVDAYGNRRRTYSEGQFHSFDAVRMSILGKVMEAIEEFLKAPAPVQQPVYDLFGDGGDY